MIELPPEFKEMLADDEVPALQKDALRAVTVLMISAEIARRMMNAQQRYKPNDPEKYADHWIDSVNDWMRMWTTIFSSHTEAERAIQALAEQCGIQVMALRGEEAKAWMEQDGKVH